jgi:hypothetical protein
VTDLIQTDMTNFTMVNGIAVYTYRNVARAAPRAPRRRCAGARPTS